ncbi:MAG: glycosyltransferase [Alphaproteobacteria bacterium]|nr:glycosyltransferase [Alphaproteobacteria bacterium]
MTRAAEAPATSPHPLFDLQYYREANPDLPEGGATFGHYLSEGWRKLCSPHPLFSVEFYLSNRPDVRSAGVEPLGHFITRGWKEGANPHPLFNVDFYLTQVPDLNGLDPLTHYIMVGRSMGLEPNDGSFKRLPIVHGEKRVIIIDSVYPAPDRDAGSVFVINFIRIFQSLGYAVYFAATASFDPYALDAVSVLARKKLAALDVTIVDSEYSVSLHEFVRLNGGHFQIAFLSRVYCGGEFYEHFKAHAAQTKLIFSTVDLHHIRERREGSLNGDLATINASYWTEEREIYLARLCDATIVVSRDEVETLSRIAPGANIYMVPLINEVPGRTRDFSERRDIGFIGGYRHKPNIDAVHYFLDEIWPLVRAELRDARFRVIGADLPEDISSRTDEGVEMVGYVPDIGAILEQLRLTVAPLRYGAGAKGKVVSSLCYGVPCVGTPIAAEGMGLNESSGALVASAPVEFARRIVEIYHDRARWEAMSQGGVEKMRRDYSLDTGVTLIKHICDEILPNSVSE